MAKIIFFLDFKDKSKKRKETGVDGKYFFYDASFLFLLNEKNNYFYY